jgi:hypothetical protein
MDSLSLIAGTAAAPLFMLVLAGLFAWRYRRRVEAAMRRAVHESRSLAPAVAPGEPAESPVAPVPLELRRVDAAAASSRDPAGAAAGRWISEARRPLVVAVATAGGVHFTVTTVALLWSAWYMPAQARVALGYLVALPEIGLLLAFTASSWRPWVLAALAYLAVGVALVPLAGGAALALKLLGAMAQLSALLPLTGVALIVSRRLRPVAIGLVALLVFFGSGALLIALFTDVDALLSAMNERRGLSSLGVAIQLAGTLVFAWLLGRQSIALPGLALAAIGASGPLIDVAFKPSRPIGPALAGVPGTVLQWYAVWLLFKGLSWIGERRVISNRVLQYHLGWGFLTFYYAFLAYFGAAIFRRGVGPVWLVLGAFGVYGVMLHLLLRRHWLSRKDTVGKRLVLLRVFGSPRKATRLLEMLGDTWRLFGSVDLIAGTDVASLTVSPKMLEAFLRRRVEDVYLKTPREVDSRLAQLDRRLEGDGRYPINELHCFANAWQYAVIRLVPESDVVLMDLRGFSRANLGCAFELTQLVNLVPLRRIVLLADRSTDMPALEDTLRHAWGGRRRDSPNANDARPVLDIVAMPALGVRARRYLASRLVAVAGR